jgi:hypothetical protein
MAVLALGLLLAVAPGCAAVRVRGAEHDLPTVGRRPAFTHRLQWSAARRLRHFHAGIDIANKRGTHMPPRPRDDHSGGEPWYSGLTARGWSSSNTATV